MSSPMLVWYIGECMILIINTSANQKPNLNLPRGHQNCNTKQILVYGGHSKTSESLYARFIIWVHTKNV